MTEYCGTRDDRGWPNLAPERQICSGGPSPIGTYTGDPPSGLMARGAFLGFESLDRKVCGDVDAVVPVPAWY
jgi:hypothetical protein